MNRGRSFAKNKYYKKHPIQTAKINLLNPFYFIASLGNEKIGAFLGNSWTIFC